MVQKQNTVFPPLPFVPLAHSDFVNSSTTFWYEPSLFGYEFLSIDCELLGEGGAMSYSSL